MLFSQVLTELGVPAIYGSASSLAAEQLEKVRTMNPALVVISALPPRAFAHARYLVKRLRTQWPDKPIIVGLWNSTTEIPKAQRRMTSAGTDQVTTSFTQATEVVRQLAQRYINPPPPAQ
jgi:hypothetical protein